MEIIVKCDLCGNESRSDVLSHKYIQFDDSIKRDKFLLEYESKEVLLQCQKCKDWN